MNKRANVTGYRCKAHGKTVHKSGFGEWVHSRGSDVCEHTYEVTQGEMGDPYIKIAFGNVERIRIRIGGLHDTLHVLKQKLGI